MRANHSSLSLSFLVKSFSLVGVIIISVTSCMGDGMSDEYKEYLAQQPMPELNELEISFIDSLENLGYKDVDILLPYAWGDSYVYDLSFKPPYKLTKNNLDSVRADVLNITKELFSKKVSNNILYDTHAIWVIPWIESDSIKTAVKYVKMKIGAKDFYKELGFKVVMNKDSTFSKIYFDGLE